jgi:hypothetical protein
MFDEKRISLTLLKKIIYLDAANISVSLKISLSRSLAPYRSVRYENAGFRRLIAGCVILSACLSFFLFSSSLF